MNKIKFKVKAHKEISIESIIPFQGELKKLSKENEAKLRKAIVEDGFNFAPHVWKQDGNYFILDGHQRIHVLGMLHRQGYQFVDTNDMPIDGIPCNVVEADSIDDARKKVLQAVSQYGKIDRDGFLEFTEGMDLKSLELDYDFPDFKMDFDDNDIDEKEVKLDDEKEYLIVIELDNEVEQADIFEELTERGLKCKIM